MKREKLNIRVPSDDDHGPNPYDSKTKPEDLPGNQWLVSGWWWMTILGLAAVWSISAWLKIVR